MKPFGDALYGRSRSSRFLAFMDSGSATNGLVVRAVRRSGGMRFERGAHST